MTTTPSAPAPDLAAAAFGTVVSTRTGRGHFCVADFASDAAAVQYAYDAMVTRDDLPRTLVLDAPDRPFAFEAPLEIWQSHCRVTSTGGVTITPADGYTGPLIQSNKRPETEVGEDNVICNVTLDHLWLNGDNRSLGVQLRDLQLSTVHDLHVRRTDGPGLWISDGCIENQFASLVLSDECGSMEQPALLIEPESPSREPDIGVSNLTVNSTYFSGIMIHFPTNDCLRISAKPMAPSTCKGHRKIQFNGCFFHCHPRQNKPVATIADAFQITFIGTQMLGWNEHSPVLQLGTDDAHLPTGVTLISHCVFGSKPGNDAAGIRAVNVCTDGPCLSAFGNAFGSGNKLAHAVDWGSQQGKTASWAGNTMNVTAEPFLGTPPTSADIPPFAIA